MTFLIHFLTLSIKFIAIILVMHSVFGSRLVLGKKIWIKRAAFCMSILLIGTCMEHASLKYGIMSIYPIINVLSACLIMDLTISDCIRKSILAYLLEETMGTIVYLLCSFLFGIKPEEFYDYPKYDLLCGMFILLICVEITFLTRRNTVEIFLNMKTFLISLVIEIFMSLQVGFVTYVLGDGVRNNIRMENLFVIVIMIGSSVSMAFYYLYIRKLEQVKDLQHAQIDSLRQEQLVTQRYYTKLYEKNEQTRARQHDVHHMLQMLGTLVEEGDTQEALRIIKEWTRNEHEGKKLVYSQNRIIDSVIDGLLGTELENEDIRFLYKGRVPEKTGIDDLDLCLLVSNLLENAKEAVIGLDACKREICMEIGMKERLLFLDIRNPYDKERCRQEEKEKGWHGYGLKNIQEIVHRYNGDINIKKSGQEFGVHIVLEGKLPFRE